MSCWSSSAERLRNAADSRYPAINCRIADTSAASRRVSPTGATQSVTPATVAADAPQHATADAAAAAGDEDEDALCDESFLTLRSVGAERQKNVKLMSLHR